MKDITDKKESKIFGRPKIQGSWETNNIKGYQKYLEYYLFRIHHGYKGLLQEYKEHSRIHITKDKGGIRDNKVIRDSKCTRITINNTSYTRLLKIQVSKQDRGQRLSMIQGYQHKKLYKIVKIQITSQRPLISGIPQLFGIQRKSRIKIIARLSGILSISGISRISGIKGFQEIHKYLGYLAVK